MSSAGSQPLDHIDDSSELDALEELESQISRGANRPAQINGHHSAKKRKANQVSFGKWKNANPFKRWALRRSRSVPSLPKIGL